MAYLCRTFLQFVMKIKKNLWPLLFCILCISACKKHPETQPQPQEQKTDTLHKDSLLVETNTETNETLPPKKADEFFDDFAFAFMKNHRFQRKRIEFPLPYIIDGKRKTISSSAWKHDPMYSTQEVYTLIFDSAKGAKMAKDTSVHHVVVEELDLDKHRVKSYTFSRKEAQWKLTELCEQNMEKSSNSDFYEFYKRFATDEEYQNEHIANQLAFSTYDEDNFKRVEGFITAAQWKDFAPELPQSRITNILYGQTYKNSHLRVLSISSLSGGMVCTLTFKHKKGRWMLTRLDN